MASRCLLVSLCTAAALACGSSSTSSQNSGQSTDGGSSSGGGSGAGSSGGGSGSSGSSGGSGGSGSSSGTQSDAGTVGGVPGGVAGPGTSIQGCQIFPPDNPWNVAIDGPNVQVVHTYDAQLAQTAALHPDFGGYTSDTGGIPFNPVPSGQADLTVDFTLYANESDPGPGGWIGTNPVTSGSAMGATGWPFLVGMKIEGNPPAGGTPGTLPGDQHGLVLQQGSGGCTSYEAWNCVVVSSAPFPCANGAVFDLTSNKLRPAGWTSGDAAGLSILAGLVRLAEVQAGTVTHAIRVTFNTTQQGYIPPATHAAGSQSLGSAYPPMGLRLRLKSNVDTSSATKAGQVIMAAMKKYGLMVADNGSDWFFQGDSDDGWTATAPDGQDTIINELVSDFRKLHGSDFEAINSGDAVNTGL